MVDEIKKYTSSDDKKSDDKKDNGLFTPAPPGTGLYSPAPAGTGLYSPAGGGNSGGGSPSGGVSGGGNQITDNKSFEQAPPKSQVEFMNKITENQRVSNAALAADQNAISLSLGLQGSEVPKETLAAYAGMASLRAERSAGVIKGTSLQGGAMGKTGSDATYPTGTFSPMNTERFWQTEKVGGSFFLSSGELPPQNERNVQGLPQWNIPKPTEGNNIVTTTQLPGNGLYSQEKPQTFAVQGAPVFGGYDSVEGYTVNLVAPAPLMSVQPSKSPYGYSMDYKATIGKKEAAVFSPTAEYTSPGVISVSLPESNFVQPVGMSVMPKDDIPYKVLGGLSINQFQQELNLAPTANAFGVSPGFVRNMVNNPGTYKSEATGTILSSYAFTNAKGEKMVGFGNAVRDYSLLPAGKNPDGSINQYGNKALRDVASTAVGYGVEKAYEAYTIIAPPLKYIPKITLPFIGDINAKETLSGLSSGTVSGAILLTPFGQGEAVGTGTMGTKQQKSELAIELGIMAAVGAVSGGGSPKGMKSKTSTLTNEPYLLKSEYIADLAQGKARENVYNPVFTEKGSIIKSINGRIIEVQRVDTTTRIIHSEPIKTLPGAIGTDRGIFTDITEGATVKMKRTTQVYQPGTSTKYGVEYTTGYSVKGDIYGQKGSLTAGMGDLATIEQNMIFIPKRGEAEFYKFTNTGTAASSMSIPIEGFGVGRIKTQGAFGSISEYSTMNVLGREVRQPEVVATYNPRTRNFEVSDYARVKINNIEGKSRVEQNRNVVDILQEASRYRSTKASKVSITIGNIRERALGQYFPYGRKVTVVGVKQGMSQVLQYELTHDVFEMSSRGSDMMKLLKAAKVERQSGVRLPRGYAEQNAMATFAINAPERYTYKMEGYANELLARTVSGEMKPTTPAMQLFTAMTRQRFFGDANLNVLSFRQSTRPIMESGYKTFGTIKTQEGKPVAMVEYFSKTEPQTVELMPEPRAYKAGGRQGGMKPMAIQVQVQSVPTALKYAPTTKATPTIQIQKTITQPTTMAFSISDYDKPIQVGATSSKSIFKIGSLGGQALGLKITQSTGLKSYFQPSTAEKTYQQPQQKFYQPTDTGLKGYVGGGLKVYTPQEPSQKFYQPLAQKIYQAQPQATKTVFTTPTIPTTGTPFVKVPYKPPEQPPFIPPSFGGDMSGGFEYGKKSKKQKGKYSPSFIAVTLGIRGKPGKSELSGFAVRPMALAGKKRR